MASQAVHVPDWWEAVRGGTVPGGFADGGARYVFPTVTSTDARGGERNWRVYVEVLGPQGGRVVFDRAELLQQPVAELAGHRGVVSTESWHTGGALHAGKQPTYVEDGRNKGKKNATNVATQALRDALGLYNKHIKACGAACRVGAAAAAAAEPAGAAGPAGAPRVPAHAPRPLPMLVKKLGDTVAATLTLDHFRKGLTVQRKLNGVRVVGRPADGAGGAEFYSRKGGTYGGMPALSRQAGALLARADEAWQKLCAGRGRDPWASLRAKLAAANGVPEGGLPPPYDRAAPPAYIDGELYQHGKSLRWISGQARSSTGGATIEFWAFDCFFPALQAANVPVASRTRQTFLDLLFAMTPAGAIPNLRRVENFPAECPPGATLEQCMGGVDALARRFLREGYEGAIVRKDWEGYQYGANNYHSSHLVKIKPILDSEFPVVGYTQGDRGKDRGAVIWICEVPAAGTPAGKAETFSVVPKNLSYEERYRIFRCLGQVVGTAGGKPQTRYERDFHRRPLTVEYPELSSKTGKPTQAKALTFRTYEPEPGCAADAGAGCPVAEEPVARLLRECRD